MTQRLYKPPPDFEAMIRIYSSAEGGRASPPSNGIRWDFAYAEDGLTNNLFMIWPDFVDENGTSLPADDPLPVGVELRARMTVMADEMRSEVHRMRIREGVQFYCHEGARRVAVGRVTRVTGLHSERERAA